MALVVLVMASACALLGLAFFLLARGAARRRRWQRMLAGCLAGLLFMPVSALLATVSSGSRRVDSSGSGSSLPNTSSGPSGRSEESASDLDFT